MAIGYKNLILIDNSKSMGEPNFLLCKETAKYICGHLSGEDSCRVADFGEEVSYLTDYSDDAQMLSQCIDGIEMYDRDTYITDNLVNILTEWEEQDVACRNILLFTDGGEKESVLHANEELYYMLSEAGYPVYIVQCVESRNVPASKNLSAIAKISGGKLLLTEFEGSEGGSEKIMGEKILSDIDSKRKAAEQLTADAKEHEENEEENTEDDAEEENSASEESNTEDEMYISNDKDFENQVTEAEAAEQEHITGEAYSSADNTPIIRNAGKTDPGIGFNVLFPALGLFFAIIFAIVIYVITKRNIGITRRDMKILEDINEDLEREARIAEDAEEYDCCTFKLSDDCAGTRLLDQAEWGYDITLEDCSDPTRLYRASCDESLIVGRAQGACDIVIDHDDSVSGRHCELSVRNGCWYVRDLQSSNGTKVNNQKVFQELMLKKGDILQLGRSALQVSI